MEEVRHFIKKVLKVSPLYSAYLGVADHFWPKFRQHRRRQREESEKKLPKLSLSQDHIEHCELVLDRAALLAKLPNSGVVAEIGVAKGEFSSQILHKTNPESLHLIDIWDSERYHHLYGAVRSRFDEEIEDGTVEISQRFSTEAADHFPDDYFDWVYIDTDHAYETTRDELQAYAPKIKAGGIIAGHDYTLGNWKKAYRYGVIEAVHEFCVRHNWKLAYLTAEVKENRSFAIKRMGE
ncbi:class I SAM-dependent methyltransferase [Salinibacter ruber]|uniref:class I SAM-dependent methyltransferase n=1 Tax=Salinibacter ruber TaxID=146919 RepID=UPI000E595B13|nr:class I SAM-dependent methyltransferase [Salinibacter ruber]